MNKVLRHRRVRTYDACVLLDRTLLEGELASAREGINRDGVQDAGSEGFNTGEHRKEVSRKLLFQRPGEQPVQVGVKEWSTRGGLGGDK